MKNTALLLLFTIFIYLFKFSSSFSGDLKNNKEFKDIINKYYLDENYESIQADEFVENDIDNNSTKYYLFSLLNDTEEIYFDFQSEYGCLNIYFNENINNNLSFCSLGTNNIFILSKNEILDKIGYKETIKGLNINIMAEFPALVNNNSKIHYSLKVSLKKPNLNIFEIKSFHKILCKTEKINETNFCLFILTNISLDQNLIVYSKSQSSNTKLNIAANFINISKFNDSNYLSENIPNETSIYNNYLNDTDFIVIPNLNKDKYIYISIESTNETTIEILVNKINNYTNQKPKINEFNIYSINNNISNYMNLDFIEQKNEISLCIGVINGKGSIQFNNYKSKEYIIDTNENKIIFNLNKELLISSSYKLIINNLEEFNETKLGFIFYIYFENRNNILNKITNNKSIKIINKIPNYPLVLYEQLSEEDSSLNINLQLYECSIIEAFNNSNLEIELMILSKEELYELKLDYENIKYYEKIIKKFDNILSVSHIDLSSDDFKSFNINENSWLVINIPIYNNYVGTKEIILGCSLFNINNLNYPSERIYYYGEINVGEKVVYKLKGNVNYHLMRLEFGHNSEFIGWSVKRTNENKNYKSNDTDLSFVTERWVNGRELLTMYIERGEDIYLTVYIKENLDNINLTNLTHHVFKYINSGKNGDFKNYLIKYDSLDFNKRNNLVTINKLSKIPDTSTINYYLKIIKKQDYIEKESINTIAITQSNSDCVVKCSSTYKNKIICDLEDYAKEVNTYYINAYSVINENNTSIEYVSYSSLKIKIKDLSKKSNYIIILIALSFAGLTFIILTITLIIYCVKKRRLRRRRRRWDRPARRELSYYDDDLLY